MFPPDELPCRFFKNTFCNANASGSICIPSILKGSYPSTFTATLYSEYGLTLEFGSRENSISGAPRSICSVFPEESVESCSIVSLSSPTVLIRTVALFIGLPSVSSYTLTRRNPLSKFIPFCIKIPPKALFYIILCIKRIYCHYKIFIRVSFFGYTKHWNFYRLWQIFNKKRSAWNHCKIHK